MFGCQIFVTNRTFGGLKGYVSGTERKINIFFILFSTFDFEVEDAPIVGRVGRTRDSAFECEKRIVLEFDCDETALNFVRFEGLLELPLNPLRRDVCHYFIADNHKKSDQKSAKSLSNRIKGFAKCQQI